jgi:antitoxin ParD1/3/4
MEDDLLQLERLREAIDDGDESGEPEPFDIEAFLEEKRCQHPR